jgi:hypothetical protein
MHINDAINAVVGVLHVYPPLDCPEIIAEVKISGRLGAGENKRFERAHDRFLKKLAPPVESGDFECWSFRRDAVAFQARIIARFQALSSPHRA